MALNSNGLSNIVRFFVLVFSGKTPGGTGVLHIRKKGYKSFRQESNAAKCAARLAKKNPGMRVYVAKLASGDAVPPPAPPSGHTNY